VKRNVGIAMRGASLRAEGTLLVVPQKISIIDSNPILYKQCTILVGKRDPLVMLFLLHDISDYRVLFTGTFAKTGIFSRPTYKIREVWVCFQPFAAISLYTLDERCYGIVGGSDTNT